MKKMLTLLLLASFIASVALPLYAQGQIRVIREAQEANKTRVAITGDLTDDIFEITVIARMKRTKPMIHNVIVVGPGLGRLSCETKETLVATTEEDVPFVTERKDKGLINFGKSEDAKTSEAISETNVHKGTATKALYTFRIPRDKVKKDKKYKLWVQVMSSQKGSEYDTFKFDLENFAELVLQ